MLGLGRLLLSSKESSGVCHDWGEFGFEHSEGVTEGKRGFSKYNHCSYSCAMRREKYQT